MSEINGAKLTGVKLSEYMGHPQLEFGSDRYPFKFGGTKAKHLLDAMKRNGVQPILDAMLHLISINDPEWVAEFTGVHIAEGTSGVSAIVAAAMPKSIPVANVVTSEDLAKEAPKVAGKPILHDDDEEEAA